MISVELRRKYIKNIGNCEINEAEIEKIIQLTDGMKILDFKNCIKEASKLPEKEFAENTGIDMSLMDQLVGSGVIRKVNEQDFVSSI